MVLNEILRKIEFYCSYQDRCYKEIEKKLKEFKIDKEEKDEILIHLIENKFINEERFANSFTRGKHFYKNWGRNRIKQELKFRDISATNINIALNEIEDGYTDRFYEYAQKKWDNITEANILKKKNKFVNQMSYKGYEANLIFSFLDDLHLKDIEK